MGFKKICQIYKLLEEGTFEKQMCKTSYFGWGYPYIMMA